MPQNSQHNLQREEGKPGYFGLVSTGGEDALSESHS